MKNLEQEYWFCIIGSTTRDKLPFGADGLLRQSVKNTYEKMTDDIDYTCSSGWGMKQDMVDVFQKLQNLKFLNSKKFERLKKEILSIKTL